MNRANIARLLGLAAAYDARTIGEADVAAWQLALDGLDVERCKAAVVRHYRESTDRVMPAHIRRLARTTTGAPDVIPETGETYCETCKGVHRQDESCSILIRRTAIDGPDPSPPPRENSTTEGNRETV